MNTYKPWGPPLAVTLTAAVCAAAFSTIRRRYVRATHHEQKQADLKAWENEGGNHAGEVVDEL